MRASGPLAIAALLAASQAHAAKPRELKDLRLDAAGAGAELAMRFTGRVSYKIVESGNPELYVVDFEPAIYRPTRRRLSPPTKFAKYAVVSQYDRRTVRLVIRRDSRARVDVDRVGPRFTVRVRPPASGLRPGDAVVAAAPAPAGAKPAAAAEARPVTPVAFPSQELSKKPRIVIDPGHGGRDPGAVGPHTTDKAVALAVAKLLKEIFAKDARLEVYFTRLEDKFVALEDRGALAHRVGADLFLSLHANAGPRSARGYEVWYLSNRGSRREARRLLNRSPEALGPQVPDDAVDLIQKIIVDKQREGTQNKSSLLAGHLDKALKKTGQKSRGVGEENFAVLRSVAVPSVLLELGFLTNPREERKLMSTAFLRKQAQAIYRGVLAYLESQGRLGEGGKRTLYAVRKNDTLGAIAARLGVELVELAAANGLGKNSRIYVGQLLEVPADPVGSLIGEHIE